MIGFDPVVAVLLGYVRRPGSVRQRPSLRILRRLFTALTDPAGVTAARARALERVVQLLLADWQHTTQRLTEGETRMTSVLDELGL